VPKREHKESKVGRPVAKMLNNRNKARQAVVEANVRLCDFMILTLHQSAISVLVLRIEQSSKS